MFITLLLVTINAHAAFAPPETDILPKLFITQFKNNTLYLNNNISLNIDKSTDSWKNIPYNLASGDVKTLECKGDYQKTNRVLSCNRKYLLQLNVTTTIDDLESCKNRFPTVLIDRDSGKKIILSKKLSACTYTTAVIESNGWIWFASYWSGDHGNYSGDGLFRVNTTSGNIEFISRNGKDKQGWPSTWKDDWSHIHIFSLAADEKNHSIWFTSTLGLHHYKLDTQHLDTYYTQFSVADKGGIHIALSKTKPEHDLSLYTHLINLKIHNKIGFVKAWQKLNLSANDAPPMHDNLIPYYLETLRYLSDSHNDMYLFNTIVHSILMFNKNKYATQLELLYNNNFSLNRQASLKQIFHKFGLQIKNTTNDSGNEYLLAFIEGKKTYWQLCEYYRKDKFPINKVNIELLARSGKQLSDVLSRCFNDGGWNLEDKLSKDFISKLYDTSNQQSKLAVCRFFNRKRWYEPDNQLLEKVVLDLPVFSKKYGFALHECSNWLLKVITTDEQILFIQNIRNSDRAFYYAKSDLFSKLQRHRNFPIFKKQHDLKIKQQEDTCRRQRKTESIDVWKVRCKDTHKMLPMFQPINKPLFSLPPPVDRDKPTIIYKRP